MPGMDPAVKKETGYIAVWVILLSVIMEAVFLVIRQWDLSVLFGNLGGAAAATGSFFLLALTVSRAVSSGKPEAAAQRVKASAGLRLIGMGGICALMIGDSAAFPADRATVPPRGGPEARNGFPEYGRK